MAQSLKEVLLKRTEIIPNGCWEWQGCCGSHGYGQITYKWKGLLTHRASYEVHVGPIPKGMFVLHKCDNRRCINPDHLFLGNAKDNTYDMIAKGRDRLDNTLKFRDDNIVVEIRQMLASGMYQQEIADKVGTSQATISRIKNGHSYDWVI